MKAGPEAITLILKEYLVMIRMVMMVSARGRRDIIDTLQIKFKSLNRMVLSILFFVFKLMLFFVIEQFCSFIDVIFSFFKECPHPDEKQRLDLSKRLGLENKQVKFWFQNRRTQMKVNFKHLF
jgi:hypothetical protein